MAIYKETKIPQTSIYQPNNPSKEYYGSPVPASPEDIGPIKPSGSGAGVFDPSGNWSAIPDGMNTVNPQTNQWSYTDPASLGYTTPGAAPETGSKHTLDQDVLKKMWM